jgi:hypothetical protein
MIALRAGMNQAAMALDPFEVERHRTVMISMDRTHRNQSAGAPST